MMHLPTFTSWRKAGSESEFYDSCESNDYLRNESDFILRLSIKTRMYYCTSIITVW